MTRPPFRFPLAEALVLLGLAFGVWLIQYTFQAATDAPNFVVLWFGAIDIVVCFGALSVLLRRRLQDGGALPKSWIAAAVVFTACLLGWISALLIDAERVRSEQARLHEAEPRLANLQEAVGQFVQALPANDGFAERAAWNVNHDRYAQLAHLAQADLHANPAWTKELGKIDEEVQQMQKLFGAMFADGNFDQRVKDRAAYLQACSAAAQIAGTLRGDVTHRLSDLAATYRARWQALAASALAGVFLLLGCMTLWVVFDRELRRRGKAQNRLAADDLLYRSLIEHQADPIAVLDRTMAIQYANPAWQTALNRRPSDLAGRSLFDLIHTEDRPRVQAALQAYDVRAVTPCRVAGEYGVWHEVELQCQEHDDENSAAVHLRPRRVAAPAPVKPTLDAATEDRLAVAVQRQKETEQRLAEAEKLLQSARAGEQQARSELDHQRWLLGTHKDVLGDGVLILSAQGQALSWNAAFLHMWKLSDETMSAHTWQTVAAHMETQVHTGWDDFTHAAHPPKGAPGDACWEMHLEGGRTLEVYTQVLNDHPARLGAIQFHFRDVSKHRELESQARLHDEEKHHWNKSLHEHEEHKKSYEMNLKEREKRLKHLEKQVREREDRLREIEDALRQREERCRELEQALAEHDGRHQHLTHQLRERDRQREELEADLRDHQERLHDLHDAHERHADNLRAGKESMRRLANGIAADFNKILSVVLGNADVLHESLPKDHLAQTCVDEIKHAANQGAELSQRLLAFGRNHLLQLVPVDMNRQLSALDGKIRAELGHDVQLHWEYANQELWVKTDPHPFEQAILHVVTHAHQHMPNGGTLTIRTNHVELGRRDLPHADMAPGPYVEVVLQDSGAGMDEETLTHLFEPYHPTKEGHKGDLSLATAYGILRQSGGCIEVESRPGHGAEWTILLPSTEERPHANAQEPLRASA